MEKQYTYDAFISYRHAKLDKFVAENLHKQMEAFRLPGRLPQKQSGRSRIERVFRDKDELPLTSNLEEPIQKALQESEYLIVVCSPRLRESLWCKKEIETFIALHGREKVLAVLAEGEPEESFPESLLYAEETIQKPDGSWETVRKPLEPLAADVRGKNRHEIRRAMKTEILRLLAPMFSLGYDDLRQRHRERKMKRILAASLTGAAVCAAFGTVSTALALRIQNQKEQIEKQSTQIQEQNSLLLKNQAESLAQDSLRQLAEGDRVGAIQTAVEALTAYEGIEMPYTAEAQYALTESLHVYDSGRVIKPQYQLNTMGVIDFTVLSPNWETLVTYDSSGALTIWDIGTGSVLGEIRDIGDLVYTEYMCTFLGDDRFAYLNEEREVAIYTISQNAVTEILEDSHVGSLCGDPEGKYLVTVEENLLNLYAADTLERLASYEGESGMYFGNRLFFDSEGRYLLFEEVHYGEDRWLGDKDRALRFWNLEENTFCEPVPVKTSSVKQMRMVEDTAYILLNNSDEIFENIRALIISMNPRTGEIFWQQEYKDCFGTHLFRPYAEGADKLLLATTSDARLIAEEDGTECARFALGSDTAGGAVYLNRDQFLLFTRTGENHYIMGDVMNDYYFVGTFACHSQNVKEFRAVEEGFLVLPYSDNRITVYDYSSGPDLLENSQPVTAGTSEYLTYNKAVETAKEQGLPKAELAEYVFYNEDKSLMGVYYSDDSLEIYRTGDGELLFSRTEVEGMMWQFVGTDREGHLFVGGSTYSYMLSFDFQLLAKIEGLVAVDGEAGRLIVEDGKGIQYTLPIYTVEELLAIAEPYVLR